MQSLTGRLLLASRQLADPNFHRSVVLLVQHGKEGALGLVLNRPLEVTIRDACDEALEASCRADGVLHQGGPCQGPLMALHTHVNAPCTGAEDRCEVFDGLFFSTDRDELEWLLRKDHPGAIFFLGYSGWGPGQLEAELADGTWLVAKTDPKGVFDAAKPGQWSRLITSTSLEGRVKPELIPDDSSLN